MKKTPATAVVSILLILLMCVKVLCAVPIEYLPQWNNINTMNSVLVFDGTNGNASASAYGKSGTTKVEGALTVYRQSGGTWEYVDSESETTTSKTYVSLSVDFNAVSGGYYKSVFEVTVTRNGIEESETKYSYKTCP